jgi:hypothetical protein
MVVYLTNRSTTGRPAMRKYRAFQVAVIKLKRSSQLIGQFGSVTMQFAMLDHLSLIRCKKG